MTTETATIARRAAEFRERFQALREEVGKVIVGQRGIVDDVLITIFAGGHALLEGVPGLGKTLLVKTLSQVLALEFRRMQFTPDLMPADILGTNMVVEDAEGRRRFEFQKGPIFGQIVLADEVNRATPKTQSALLEAMQEKCVTAGGVTHRLTPPFFVIATQNPLEMDGTYPLPEAQLDRFLMKLLVGYPTRQDLFQVLERTVDRLQAEPARIMNVQEIEDWKSLVVEVVVAPHVRDYGVRLALATHPEGDLATPSVKKYVRYGSSPRGVQALLLTAKIRALLDSRYNVSFADLKASAAPVLRHRILLNFEGEAERISTDSIVAEILEQTKEVEG